jgi:hypothetical protein
MFESDSQIDKKNQIEGLISRIKRIIENYGYKPYVSYERGKLFVQFILKEKETMQTFFQKIKIFEKIKTDILLNYDTEFKLYQTKDRKPIMSVSFCERNREPDNETFTTSDFTF